MQVSYHASCASIASTRVHYPNTNTTATAAFLLQTPSVSSVPSSSFHPQTLFLSHNILIQLLLRFFHTTTTAMSLPADATDSKTAHLLQNEEQQPVEAPPSYAAASKPVIGDGNVFSDIPRPGMSYSADHRQAYIPRSERKGTWSFGLFSCFSDPAASPSSLLQSPLIH